MKCKQCGSRNTVKVPKETLKEALEESSGSPVRLGATGTIDPDDLKWILRLILELLEWLAKQLFGDGKKKKRYVLCKDCGFYKKLKKK